MDSILQQITDWLKEMLVEAIMGNLSGLFDSVNNQVGEIASDVGMTPANFSPGVFAMIRNISENVIIPIAGLILTFIVCHELIQLIIDHNNLANFETWIFFKWVFKTFVEVMVLLIQFMTTVILQNVFFGFLSFLPFVAAIGGFEYAYQKKASSATEKTKNFRKKFYKISAWLGLYFPIRFIVSVATRFYPRPYNVLVLEVIILAIYIAAATCVNLSIDKSYLPKE